MATMYVQESVNLYCGDDDPTKSKHLTLEEHALPVLEERFEEHTPGGSRIAVEVSMGLINPLSSSFKLKGWDPDLLSQFGVSSRHRRPYSSYGLIRDKRTNRAIESKAIIEGRLAKIEGDARKRGEFMGHDYEIKEIWHYELWFDGREKVFFDFLTQEFRIDGVSENADERRILRIPGGY